MSNKNSGFYRFGATSRKIIMLLTQTVVGVLSMCQLMTSSHTMIVHYINSGVRVDVI